MWIECRRTDLYDHSNCRMVADFIGRVKFFSDRIIARNDGQLRIATVDLGDIDLLDDGPGDRDVDIAACPEKLDLCDAQLEPPFMPWDPPPFSTRY